jgi:lactoylglutathione lyase
MARPKSMSGGSDACVDTLRGDGGSRPSMQFRMTYTGIRVKNIEESLRFYTEVLGMQVVEPLQPTPPTEGQVVTLRSSGSAQLLELNWYGAGSRFGTPYSNGEDLDHLAFECDDLAKAVGELERLGVEVIVRPREIGEDAGWNEAFVKDPNGIWIELLQAKRKPAAFS